MVKPFVLFIIMGIILATIFLIPVGQSVSYSIETGASSRAAWSRQQQQQAAEWHQMEVERAAAVQGDRIARNRMLVWGGGIFAILAMGGVAMAAIVWVNGSARADVKKRYLQANLIPLGPDNQYPLLVAHSTENSTFVYNPNTTAVTRIDKSREPLPMLVDGATSVQLASAANEPPKLIGVNE